MSPFPFGQDAIVTPDTRQELAELRAGILEAVEPGTLVESILAEELLHAQWELHRVRSLGAQPDCEPRLHDASRRATRNWHRARKELALLQSARAAAPQGFPSAPLADANRAPELKISSRMVDWVHEQFRNENTAPDAYQCLRRAMEEF